MLYFDGTPGMTTVWGREYGAQVQTEDMSSDCASSKGRPRPEARSALELELRADPPPTLLNLPYFPR